MIARAGTLSRSCLKQLQKVAGRTLFAIVLSERSFRPQTDDQDAHDGHAGCCALQSDAREMALRDGDGAVAEEVVEGGFVGFEC